MITAALMLVLLMQEPQTPVAQASDTRLGLVSGDASVSRWLSEPVEIEPGVWRVWWWTFLHPPAESDGMSRAAFLHEVHCRTGQLSQGRYELYADDRILRGYDRDLPLHHPVAHWADPEIMERVCGDTRPEVVVPDATAAAAHFHH